MTKLKTAGLITTILILEIGVLLGTALGYNWYQAINLTSQGDRLMTLTMYQQALNTYSLALTKWSPPAHQKILLSKMQTATIALRVLGTVSVKAKVVQPSSPAPSPTPTASISPFIPPDELIASLAPANISFLNNLSDSEVFTLTSQTKNEIIDRPASLNDSMLDAIIGKLTFAELLKAPRYQVQRILGTVLGQNPITGKSLTFRPKDPIFLDSKITVEPDSNLRVAIPEVGLIDIVSSTIADFPAIGIEEAMAKQQVIRNMSIEAGESEFLVVRGPHNAAFYTMTANVIVTMQGTHFWVTYDAERDYTIVGVYKGELTITPNIDMNPILLKPQGNEPGVAIITTTVELPLKTTDKKAAAPIDTSEEITQFPDTAIDQPANRTNIALLSLSILSLLTLGAMSAWYGLARYKRASANDDE